MKILESWNNSSKERRFGHVERSPMNFVVRSPMNRSDGGESNN